MHAHGTAEENECVEMIESWKRCSDVGMCNLNGVATALRPREDCTGTFKIDMLDD